MEENNMARIAVVDSDSAFIIDPKTKSIIGAPEKNILAQSANKSERFSFYISTSVIEGHDLSTCNSIMVHYDNIEEKTLQKSSGIYSVRDFVVAKDGSASFSWLLDPDATVFVGGLIFSIHFANVAADGTVEYDFPTLTYSKITVGSTVWNSETIAKNHPDILAGFDARINALENGGAVAVKNAVLYTAQELTKEQKAQARANIGAAEEKVVVEDIPFEQTGNHVTFETTAERPVNITGVVETDGVQNIRLVHCGENLLPLDKYITGQTVTYEDGWITIDHTAVAASTNYDLYWLLAQYPVIKPATKYRCLVEISGDSGKTGGDVIFSPFTINSAQNALNHAGAIYVTDATVGKTYYAVVESKADLSACTQAFFTRLTVRADTTAHVKFRCSVAEAEEDDTVTTSSSLSKNIASADETVLGYHGTAQTISLSGASAGDLYEVPELSSYDGVNNVFVDSGVVTVRTTVPNTGEQENVERVVVVQQYQTTNSVTKEVVQTQVETVQSGRNAANHGVLPSNSATVNTTNLQALLDVGGTITVDVPGTYNFSGTLFIGSNTELIFGEQVVCSMDTTANGGFILNKGALTKEYDTNITIKGLHLQTNGATKNSSHYVPGLRGIVAFYYVKNLKLLDMWCDDFGTQAYFMHLSNWEHVLIDNLYCVGNKDGIHMSRGRGMTIRRCRFDTLDDPIALNSYDYISGCPELGLIEDVLVENCVDMERPGKTAYGRFAHIISGSWLDWVSGNAYKLGHACVASNGCVYRLTNTTAVGDISITSTIEPTHTDGTVTYNDGCSWVYTQSDTLYATFCRNITFRDVVCEKPRTNLFNFIYENTVNCYSYYPGSHLIPHQNITIDNVRIPDGHASARAVYLRAPVDLIRFVNCDLELSTIFINVEPPVYDIAADNDLTRVIFTNNYLRFAENASSFGFIYDKNLDHRFILSAQGNMKNRDVRINFNSNFTMKANDLNA